MKQKIILASQSPRRRELLRALGIKFRVVPSRLDESKILHSDPVSYVKRLAVMKAKKVAEKERGIIIAADTMVVLDGKMYGQPKDKEDAFRTLKKLSGKVHGVVTGVCVMNTSTGKLFVGAAITKIKFRRLSDELINIYIRTEEPMGKAGSYNMKGKAAVLIEWIDGDYNNVIGLPVDVVLKGMEKVG